MAMRQLTKNQGLLLVIGTALVYSAVHLSARLLASRNLGEDDPFEAILSQTLQPGYQLTQPPLYNWLLWFVQQIVGYDVLGFLLIKYTLLIVTIVAVYLAASRIFQNKLWAVLTAESLSLLYNIAWRIHEGFTDIALAMCATVVCYWLYIRLVEKGTLANSLALGSAAGLGALSHFSFVVFFTALFVASNLNRSHRKVWTLPILAACFASAALVVSPYAIWWITNFDGNFHAIYIGVLGPPSDVMAPGSLSNALQSPIRFLMPLGAIWLIVLVRSLPRGAKTFFAAAGDAQKTDVAASAGDDYAILAGRCVLICWIAVLISALAVGYSKHVPFQLMPLWLLAVFWVSWWASRVSTQEHQVRVFVQLMLAIAVVAFLARAANMFALEPFCKICRWGIPYAGLAQQLRERGVTEQAIVTPDPELAGNLRRFFPKSEIIVPGLTKYVKLATVSEQQLIIWPDPRTSKRTFAPPKRSIPKGSKVSKRFIFTVPWQHLWRPTGYRVSVWHAFIVSKDATNTPPNK